MNIECGQEVLDELNDTFRYNDAVLRHLVMKMTSATAVPSIMMKSVERDEARKATTDTSSTSTQAAESASAVESESVEAPAAENNAEQ